MSCTEFHCLFALEFDRVDSDDALGTGELCALNCVRTDTAHADNNNGVTRSNICCIHSRTPTGDNTATEQACLVERNILFDLDARCFVHHCVMSEGSEHAHEREVFALCVVT